MTALKLQIRPHFVLNCLKSVYAMVQTGSREDAQQLILLLSRYLRYILSLQRPQRLCTLRSSSAAITRNFPAWGRTIPWR